MAINDPNYRYATHTWEADGVRVDYDIAFDGGYIRQTDVVAFSVLVDGASGLVTDRQVHELEFVDETFDDENWAISAHVKIEPAVPIGRRVVIFRSTEKAEPMVNYEDDSILTERNLDLANKQAIFGIAEIMDGLNAAAIAIDQQVQQIIDTDTLIRQVYEEVLTLIESGGIVSVAPRVYAWVGDGESTDFPMVGADIADAAFYDTAQGGEQLQPVVDFTIQMGDLPADTQIRLSTPPADGEVGFAVLRGYARPYTGPQPVTDLRMPIRTIPGAVLFVDKLAEFALHRMTSNSPVEVTINEVTSPDASTMRTGSYCSFVQRGSGAVSIVADDNVNLIIPAGCLARTRGVGSTISATCEDADTNTWILSGDLAKA